jgi:hypothetical protein
VEVGEWPREPLKEDLRGLETILASPSVLGAKMLEGLTTPNKTINIYDVFSTTKIKMSL